MEKCKEWWHKSGKYYAIGGAIGVGLFVAWVLGGAMGMSIGQNKVVTDMFKVDPDLAAELIGKVLASQAKG